MQSKHYRIYKPNKSQNGAASSLNFRTIKNSKGYDAMCLFWDITRQSGLDKNGNAAFTWETDHQTLKMGLADIGKIIACLRKLTKETKLFHRTANGDASFTLGWLPDGQSLSLRVAYKLSSNKTKKVDSEYKHLISVDEAMILLILLEEAVRKTHNW